MTTIARLIGKVAAALEAVIKVLAISVLVVLICTVFFQVARRTLTNKPFVEIEELSIVLAAWLAFLTVPYAVRKKVHVRIEVFIEKLPFGVRNTLELVINLAILAATLICVYYGYQLAGRKIRVPMTVLPIHQGFWFYSFPLGMGAASLFMIDNVIQILHRFQTREDYKPADPLTDAGVAGLTTADLMEKKEE